VERTGEERIVYKDLVGKPEGKKHSEDRGVEGRGSKWIRETGWEGVEWIHLAEDRDR
jgi:hypothetical protein